MWSPTAVFMKERCCAEMSYIGQNLRAVQETVQSTENACGRTGQTTVIAAVKYASDDELRELLSLGIADVGENRVQQFLAHEPLYGEYPVRVHFIGTLQKNKVKYLVGKVHAIHSVDSAELAEEIEKQARKRGVTVPVFVEVNSGRDEAKSGVVPEEALSLCRLVSGFPSLSLQGLMTMAPRSDSEAEYRTYFAETKKLAGEIERELGLTAPLKLSMGMSESFPAAILEGADMVRVGRRLFAKPE